MSCITSVKKKKNVNRGCHKEKRSLSMMCFCQEMKGVTESNHCAHNSWAVAGDADAKRWNRRTRQKISECRALYWPFFFFEFLESESQTCSNLPQMIHLNRSSGLKCSGGYSQHDGGYLEKMAAVCSVGIKEKSDWLKKWTVQCGDVKKTFGRPFCKCALMRWHLPACSHNICKEKM